MDNKQYTAPNYTQTPNEFYDEVLPEIKTMSELKVTLAIIRQTFGWHKVQDALSLSQLERLTGMNRQQVVAGCKEALKRGYVWNEKRNGRNVFGLRVGGGEIHTPDEEGGYEDHTSGEYEDHTHKRKEERKVEVLLDKSPNTSTAKPKSVALEKWLTDGIYNAMREAGYRLPNEEYKFHLGRARDMVEKDNPTDPELEALPSAFVKLWTIKGRADAPSALNELRRQPERERLVSGKKVEEYVSPQEQARRQREYEEATAERDRLMKELLDG